MTSDSFAAAQERVLARRAARQAENQARQQAQEAAIRHSAISRLPLGLNRAASPLHNLWSILQNSEGTRPAFRVGQVDAELLDEELLELLKGQVGEALKYYGPHLRDEWSQEILLALRAVLFKLSIWDNDASYGASLQNLKYTDARKNGAALADPTKWQKGLYGLFTVVGRYGWDKWEGWLADQEGGYVAPSDRVPAAVAPDELRIYHSLHCGLRLIPRLSRQWTLPNTDGPHPSTSACLSDQSSQQGSLVRVSQPPACLACLYRISSVPTATCRYQQVAKMAKPGLEEG